MIPLQDVPTEKSPVGLSFKLKQILLSAPGLDNVSGELGFPCFDQFVTVRIFVDFYIARLVSELRCSWCTATGIGIKQIDESSSSCLLLDVTGRFGSTPACPAEVDPKKAACGRPVGSGGLPAHFPFESFTPAVSRTGRSAPAGFADDCCRNCAVACILLKCKKLRHKEILKDAIYHRPKRAR